MAELTGDMTGRTAAVQQRSGEPGGNGAGTSGFLLDVPFNARVPWAQHFFLSVQNMLVMAGLFLFPGLFGVTFHLKPTEIATLYGAAFVVVGFGTVLQGVLFLNMPMVLGPWSGSLAGLLVTGKLYGLGTAFGSLVIAAAIITVLSIPITGASITQRVASVFNAPILSGGIVFITGIGLTQIGVVNWIGTPGHVGFGAGNWIGGGIALVVVAILFAFTKGVFRALAMIVGIVIGSFVFRAFAPVSFSAVSSGPWLAVPSFFHFGFGVNFTAVVLFLILLLPPIISALGFYPVIGEWGGETISSRRMAWGVFGVSLTGVAAGLLGTFSGAVYPENVGLLRSSKVGSRWVTVTAGVLFIVVGFVYKVGAVFVSIPSGVIGAAAVAMFAIIMVSGIEILSRVEWVPRNIIVLGLPTVLSVGGVFLSPTVYANYPLLARELITEPLVTGPILLVIFFIIDRLLPATNKAK
jgi:xanthine/uracil permease